MKNLNLNILVSRICDGTYCQTELVSFVNLAQKISSSYLKYQEVIGKRITGERLETSIELEDMSIDCIAELFSTDGNGKFPQLQKYFGPHFEENPKISEEDVLVLLRRLVVRKTKQELSRIFRERDPEGAKIVRNIKVAVRNSLKLNTFHEMGKEFIFYSNGFDIDTLDQDSNEELDIYLRRKNLQIPADLLETTFLETYDPNDSVSASIQRLLVEIHDFSEYQNFLSLDIIVRLLRGIKIKTFRERMAEEDCVPTPLDQLEAKEIESYINVVMENIWSKIDSLYIKAGKIEKNKAEIYQKALRDVLYDLIQKKDSSSYFRNLQFYLPELTQRDYRQNERSVFEYLAKVAKRDFRKHLEELI